jgi:hypothetical protein
MPNIRGVYADVFNFPQTLSLFLGGSSSHPPEMVWCALSLLVREYSCSVFHLCHAISGASFVKNTIWKSKIESGSVKVREKANFSKWKQTKWIGCKAAKAGFNLWLDCLNQINPAVLLQVCSYVLYGLSEQPQIYVLDLQVFRSAECIESIRERTSSCSRSFLNCIFAGRRCSECNAFASVAPGFFKRWIQQNTSGNVYPTIIKLQE